MPISLDYFKDFFVLEKLFILPMVRVKQNTGEIRFSFSF